MDAAAVPRARVALPRRALRLVGDERLVAGVRDGSRAAFEALYDRHHRGILAFCRHMLGSREEAEDAVQHTFAAAYTALLADERDVALKAWLYAIARNRCLSVLRARREQVELDDVEHASPETAGLAAEVQRREDLRDLLGDLQRLPDDQRAALVLAELGAHSHPEIAEVLGVRTAKVKALIFQAREALMSHRRAREADCGEIREQLAVLRGAALRRTELRRHVAQCEGCRSFEAEVRRQRAGMAAVLPVVPTLALKHSSLAAAFAAAGTGAAAAGGTAALATGGAVLGVKAIVAKTLVALAVTGGAGGAGYVAVDELRDDPAPPPAARPAPPPAERADGEARPSPSSAITAPSLDPADRDRGARRTGRRPAISADGPDRRSAARAPNGDRVPRRFGERRLPAADRLRERGGAPAAARPTPAERSARRRTRETAPDRTPERRPRRGARRRDRPPAAALLAPEAPAVELEPEAVAPEIPPGSALAPATRG